MEKTVKTCEHRRTTVEDSRFYKGYRFRNRECKDCKERIRTVEIVLYAYEINSGNNRERHKETMNLIKAIEKLTPRQVEIVLELTNSR